MPLLRVIKGPQPGLEFPLFTSRRPTVMGRDAGNPICIDDPRSSRRHAALQLDKGRWVVRDLGSSNGTIVNGRRLEKPAIVQDGATVQIGMHLLRLASTEHVAPPPVEVQDSRLLECVREQSGVFTCRAYQTAMDRDTVALWRHPAMPLDAELKTLVSTALAAADTLHASTVLPLTLGQAGEDGFAQVAVIRGGQAVRFDAAAGRLSGAPIASRLQLLRDLFALVVTRTSHDESLRYLIGTPHVQIDESGATPRCAGAACDIDALISFALGDAHHLSHTAPYLPPEYTAKETRAPAPTAAVVYNLGALGYHLITGTPPMGEGTLAEIEERHRSMPPAPAAVVDGSVPGAVSDLLADMLQKEPAARPGLDTLIDRLGSIPEPTQSTPAQNEVPTWDEIPQADEVDDIELEIEIDDEPVAAPAPRARATTPSPASRRRARPTQREVAAAPQMQQRVGPNLTFLPLWILIWVGLFFAARLLSKLAFGQLGM